MKVNQTAVRRHRERLGLTQAELAARLGRPQSYISNVERGARGVSPRSWRQLAAALEVPADWLENTATDTPRISLRTNDAGGGRSEGGTVDAPPGSRPALEQPQGEGT